MYKYFFYFWFSFYLFCFVACGDISKNKMIKNKPYHLSNCSYKSTLKKIGLAGFTLLPLANSQSLTPVLVDEFVFTNDSVFFISDYQKDGIATFKDSSGDSVVVYVNTSFFGIGEIINQDTDRTGFKFEIENVRSPIGVVTSPNNNIITVWALNNQIKGAIFNRNASKILDFDVTNQGSNPRITSLDNGGFAVAYQISGDLFINIFNQNATSINNFFVSNLVVVTLGVSYDISDIGDDKFAVTYIPVSGTLLFLEIYFNNGSNFSSNTISGIIESPYISLLKNDTFMITWFEFNNLEVRSQIFDNNANNLTDKIMISSSPLSSDESTLIASTYLLQNNFIIIYPIENGGNHPFIQRFGENYLLLGNKTELFQGNTVRLTSTDTINDNCFLINAYVGEMRQLTLSKYCAPLIIPTTSPSDFPTTNPSISPSLSPSSSPSSSPSDSPSNSPSTSPSQNPSISPSISPSLSPTQNPSNSPSVSPTKSPSSSPTDNPSLSPSSSPSSSPSDSPSNSPSTSPSQNPSISPTQSPSDFPTPNPTDNPSKNPTFNPSSNPTPSPTNSPTPEFDTNFSPGGFVAVVVLLIVLALILGIAFWCNSTNNYNRL